MSLCTRCNKRPIAVKSRGLCTPCNNKRWREEFKKKTGHAYRPGASSEPQSVEVFNPGDRVAVTCPIQVGLPSKPCTIPVGTEGTVIYKPVNNFKGPSQAETNCPRGLNRRLDFSAELAGRGRPKDDKDASLVFILSASQRRREVENLTRKLEEAYSK